MESMVEQDSSLVSLSNWLLAFSGDLGTLLKQLEDAEATAKGEYIDSYSY
jgi:hypothetical protein